MPLINQRIHGSDLSIYPLCLSIDLRPLPCICGAHRLPLSWIDSIKDLGKRSPLSQTDLPHVHICVYPLAALLDDQLCKHSTAQRRMRADHQISRFLAEIGYPYLVLVTHEPGTFYLFVVP